MHTKTKILIVMLIVSLLVMPSMAYPNHAGVQQLREDTAALAPKLSQWSLPYNILTAEDMVIDSGDMDLAMELLYSHYANAIDYQQMRGKVSPGAAEALKAEAYNLAFMPQGF